MIDAAALAELARDAAETLDDQAALEPGLPAVVAAALADPDTPLAISVREPQVYLPLARGSQALLLWGLRRIAWPILGVVRRSWSFSTFEPPLGYVDPRTLPGIVFRSARTTQTAPPATPRREIRVLIDAVPGPAPETFTMSWPNGSSASTGRSAATHWGGVSRNWSPASHPRPGSCWSTTGWPPNGPRPARPFSHPRRPRRKLISYSVRKSIRSRITTHITNRTSPVVPEEPCRSPSAPTATTRITRSLAVGASRHSP